MDNLERIRIRDVYIATNSQVETARITRHSLTTVGQVLLMYGLNKGKGGNQDKQRKATDGQILEAISEGLTRQEIADRLGIHVENLQRRMKSLGVSAKPSTKPAEWHYTRGADRTVRKYQGDRFEFVGYMHGRYRIKCKTCGAITERAKATILRKRCECETCKESAKLERERTLLIRTLLAVVDAKTPKVCDCCGEKFFSAYPSAKYCDRCKRKREAKSYRRRCRKYGAEYQSGISLAKVYKRDGGICQICGEPTDWNDKSWGSAGPLYPTIDHVLALANGGSHTWDNVQLAHALCNSVKRDVMALPYIEEKEVS